MLRYAAFALGTTVAFGLPQLSVAQTAGVLVQQPVVTVQETIVVSEPVIAVQQPVTLVAEPVIAIPQQPLITGTARAVECYTPEVDGPSNERALPLCAGYLQQAAGGEQYATIDRMALADTRICAAGVNCGPPADLTNIKPFYASNATASVATPVAQPVAVIAPPPPPPVAVIAPPPPVVPAPPVFASVAPLPATGLGTLGLAAAGLVGVAALVGVVALASDDDDNDSTPNTR